MVLFLWRILINTHSIQGDRKAILTTYPRTKGPTLFFHPTLPADCYIPPYTVTPVLKPLQALILPDRPLSLPLCWSLFCKGSLLSLHPLLNQNLKQCSKLHRSLLSGDCIGNELQKSYFLIKMNIKQCWWRTWGGEW